MPRKTAKADVIPVRQQNQYNCMTTSLSMALRAQGVPDEECDVQRVNKVVGAMPLRGAAWEPLLAAANHFGMRATLTLPSTVRQLKQWTDAGIPVVIAWNPENREWSHASLVFDVDDDLNVYVADPNIPDPDETVRVVPKAEFYGKWYEKSPQGFLIRRPACAIQREITADGRQVMASQMSSAARVAEEYDRQRDRRLERGDYFRREPKPLPPRSTPNPSMKVVKKKDVVIEAAGVEVTLQGREHANGFISVEIKYPLNPTYGHDYSGNPVQKAVKQMSRSDKSWVGQGTIIARRRYWLKGSPEANGRWPEVRDLSQALRETEKPLSRIRAASSKDYAVEVVRVQGPNVTLKGRGHAALKAGITVPKGWLPTDSPSIGDEFLAQPIRDRRKLRAWSFSKMNFDMFASSRRVAEGADTYSDARGSGYGSSRDYMSAVGEFNRARREAERSGWRQYFSRWSEWATSMLLGYATEVDDPAVVWFATKWLKRKKKTKNGAVRGMILENALAREKAISPEHRQKILTLLKELRTAWNAAPFEGDWFAEMWYDRDGVKYEPRWLGQYRQKAERFKPMKARAVAPKTVVDSAAAEKVSILDKLSEAAADNASLVALIEQAKGAYLKGDSPTESELKAIRHGLYRNRMRNEANHFRQASEARVAEKYLESKRKRRTTEVREKKDKDKVKVKAPRGGNPHAEDALSRKPTRGHKRKERARSVGKGHSRKQKHKKPLAASVAERFSSGD